MDSKQFIELVKCSGYKTMSYSGRCMFGKKCLGVELDQSHKICDFIGDLIDSFIDDTDEENYLEDGYDFASFLRCANQDDFGLGSVIYFPKIEYKD